MTSPTGYIDNAFAATAHASNYIVTYESKNLHII